MNINFLQNISPHRIQRRLFILAAAFLCVFSIIMTFAPAVRERSWNVEYDWLHWIGYLIWIVVFSCLFNQIQRYLPDADPFLLPISALLSGWGILTIYRIVPNFGIRQSIWLLVVGVVITLTIHYKSWIDHLRKYKYIFLSIGLSLTALTLILGKNPEGSGLNLWLGCCGIFLQPSEPLKLLFIIYLSGYLADILPLQRPPLALIAPTLFITILASLLLIIQHDLGTTFIFITIYAIMIFLATGYKRLLIISFIVLVLAGIFGYFSFDVIRLRIDSWLNPWLDPSGRSFQIIQSLIAIANGGLGGRGPGLGYPGLVPVSISDFIFTAIAEETGLAGALALFSLYLLFITRGLTIAIRSNDNFNRLLVAGLTIYIGAQAILIIGGNTRLLPLTGVTLPFVSYGGSSLLTTFLALVLMLILSNEEKSKPSKLVHTQVFKFIGISLGLGFLALSVATGWWSFWRGPDLLTRTDNARRIITDRYVRRGSLLDRNKKPINISEGQSGSFIRIYKYPDLSTISGYTNPSYGQAGLEASMDDYLRGLRGNPLSLIWIDHLLYGQPPPGLDIRLTIHLGLQSRTDELLGAIKGSIVLMNAQTGEILAIASHPTYDPNDLDEIGGRLLTDPDSPLLNRATQALYPSGNVMEPFLTTFNITDSSSLADSEYLHKQLGFYTTPDIPLPVAEASAPGEPLLISPLQLAIAASSLSNRGIRPAPSLVSAVHTPSSGWVILQPTSMPVTIFTLEEAEQITKSYIIQGTPFWQFTTVERSNDQVYTWSVSGTVPEWKGIPVIVVVLLEKDYYSWASYIGRELIEFATIP